MRFSLTIITALLFGLCQQYCLLAHGCVAAPEHTHTNADNSDHHHSHPNHKHSKDTPDTATAVPCCSILKITDSFSIDIAPPIQNHTPVRVADLTASLISHLSPPIDSHHDPTLFPNPIFHKQISRSLSIAPNAPPLFAA